MFPSQKVTTRNVDVDDVTLGVEEPNHPTTPGATQEVMLSCLDCKNTINDMSYFSSSSTMKKLQVDLNKSKKSLKFSEKIREVLKSIKKLNSDDEMHIVFLFVLQSCEDYLYDHSTDEKLDLCVALLKGFVNEDVKICRSFIKIVNGKIKKSTWLRRNQRRLTKLFFLVLSGLF